MSFLAKVSEMLSRLGSTFPLRFKISLFNRPAKTRAPEIPFEVAQLIAEHLDAGSARALCRTSKSLRVAGQLRLWRNLRVMVDIPSDATPDRKYHDVE
jgi:hypothetical protein